MVLSKIISINQVISNENKYSKYDMRYQTKYIVSTEIGILKQIYLK